MSDQRARRERLNGRVPSDRPCETAGCREPGEFKAPRGEGGDGRPDWRWLCLDHVRAFNARYNWFEGMTAEEISAAQSPYPQWERATRAFASNGYADRLAFDDNAELMRLRFGARWTEANPPGPRVDPADRRALDALGLGMKATPAEIRRRYKELVRRLHPDSNGGNRSGEGRLQAVIDAYTHLKRSAAYGAPPAEARP